MRLKKKKLLDFTKADYMLERSDKDINEVKLEQNSITNEDSDKKTKNILQKTNHWFNREKKEKPIIPASKITSYFIQIQLLNPFGFYKRGFNISVKNRTGKDENEKSVLVEEKKFSNRFQFVLLLMFLQSIPLSFAMTASLSIPWTFNIVIPFSLDFLPFNIKQLIYDLILTIQNFFKPLDPLVQLIDAIFKFFSTLNPAILFTGTFWVFDYLGWIDIHNYDLNIPDEYNNGSKTSMDILAYNLEKQFPLLGGGLITPFLLFFFSIVSFFFLITKGKKLFFEMLSEKKFIKLENKIRRPILSFYMNQGANCFEYVRNRSSKIKFIKRFFYSCIILSVIMSFTPMFFALYIIFF